MLVAYGSFMLAFVTNNHVIKCSSVVHVYQIT
jgi:hypothetical protein